MLADAAICRQKDTALHWAAFKGHAEVVQALLQAGANPVSSLHTANLCGGSLLPCCICVQQLVCKNASRSDALSCMPVMWLR